MLSRHVYLGGNVFACRLVVGAEQGYLLTFGIGVHSPFAGDDERLGNQDADEGPAWLPQP